MARFTVSMIKCDVLDCESERPDSDDEADGWMHLHGEDNADGFDICPECTKKPISCLAGEYPLPGFIYDEGEENP